MWKRDELGFPSFWLLQVVGCVGLYGLVLLSELPNLNRQAIWEEAVHSTTLFFVSLFLRPVCRALWGRSLPWIGLEIRAFGWSVAVGALASLLAESVKLGAFRMTWENFLDSWLMFSVVLFLWCTLYFSTKQWQQAAREKARMLRAESEAREARLSALRYQLNPHFLFNSLNAVSTLVLEGNAPAATRMLAQIADLLRTTLDNDAAPEIPLSQELAFVEQYLAIEQTRLGNRLRVKTSISRETLDAMVPGMLLQPLVENAVRHGVAPAIEGGTVEIESSIRDVRLRLAVRNSANARAPSDLSKPTNERSKGRRSKGIGLANTEERLKTLYGDDQQFCSKWLDDDGYEVTIEIPFRKAVQTVTEAACVH